jgi:hypothetical protein
MLGGGKCAAQRSGRASPSARTRQGLWDCSLRRIALVTVFAGVIAAVPSLAAAGAPPPARPPPPHPADGRGHRPLNLKQLWSRFPLGEKRLRTGRIQKLPGPVLPHAPRPTEARSPQAGGGSWPLDPMLAMLLVSAAVLMLAAALFATRRRRVALPTNRSAGTELRPLGTEAGGPNTHMPAAAQTAADDRPAPVRHPAMDRPRAAHLLFVPTETGYTLIERAGEAPPVFGQVEGSEVGLEGCFFVSKVGSSPLPGDERRCAYLEQT